MAGGLNLKISVKNAWEKVATAQVLQHLNWTGVVRRDRAKKKGVQMLYITRTMLSTT